MQVLHVFEEVQNVHRLEVIPPNAKQKFRFSSLLIVLGPQILRDSFFLGARVAREARRSLNPIFPTTL